MRNDFGADLRGLFPRCVRFTPTSHPASSNTRYWPVCSTLARRESHPLDYIKKFHHLIFGSSSSKFYLARYPPFPASCPFKSTMAHRGSPPSRTPPCRFPAVGSSGVTPRARPGLLASSAILLMSGDISFRAQRLVMFPFSRFVRLLPSSLQWVPWPPVSGALRFPTFVGTIRL